MPCEDIYPKWGVEKPEEEGGEVTPSAAVEEQPLQDPEEMYGE